MSVATSRSESGLDPLPEDLESPRAKLVYFALTTAGGASLSELHEALDVPKLTLLSVLDALSGRDLIEETDDEYVPLA